MKKLILSFLLLSAYFTSFAQLELSDFYGGAAFGWAQPFGEFTETANGGLVYCAEIGYRLPMGLGVGVEFNSSAVVGIQGGQEISVSVYGISNFLAKANYRLLDRKWSPYAGLGLGYARVSEPDLTINGVTTTGARRAGLGAEVEVGLDIYGVILAYKFNYGGRTPKEPVFSSSAANLNVTMHQFVVGYVYHFNRY